MKTSFDRLSAPSIDAVIASAAARGDTHYLVVLEAVRDHGVGLLVVPQNLGPFAPPEKPSISILADDPASVSQGPTAYDQGSLDRLIRSVDAAVVIAAAAAVPFYALGAAPAIAGRSSLIIETRPEHELQWLALLRDLAPDLPLLVHSVKGGTA